MQIIYMHHAEREISKYHNDMELRNLEDITETGIKEAEMIAERLKSKKISAIVTSSYIRCKHTTQIISKYQNVPIIEDDRFNEMSNGEEWKSFLERNMEAIDDIVKNYNDDDIIICMTSGVNFTAFICYFYNIVPTNETPWSQAGSISPINFFIGSSKAD